MNSRVPERDRAGLLVLLLPVLGLYLPVALWGGRLIVGPGSPGEALVHGGWGGAVLSTLLVAGGGALIAGVAGTAQALLLEAFPVPGRALLASLLLLPFLLPSAVVTAAWQALLGGGPLSGLTRDVAGAMLISAFQMTPLVLWGTARAIASIPAPERQALLSALPPWRGALRVLLRRALPVAARMTLLALLLLVPRTEVPGYTGIETIGARILAAFTAHENDREGWLLTLLATAALLPLLAMAAPALRGAAPLPLGGPRRARVEGGPRLPALLLWSSALAMLLPLTALAVSAIGAGAAAGDAWGRAAWWGGALARETLRCALVAMVVGWLGWRLALRPGWLPWLLFSLPILLPGSLPGLALLESVQHLLPAGLLKVPLLLSIAQGVRFGAVGLLFGWIARDAIPPAERRAALLLPPGLRRMRVLLPRSLPVLATSILVLTLLLLGEVECAAPLLPPGWVSPVVELHGFLHYRFDADAALLSLALAAVGVGGALLLTRLGRGLR